MAVELVVARGALEVRGAVGGGRDVRGARDELGGGRGVGAYGPLEHVAPDALGGEAGGGELALAGLFRRVRLVGWACLKRV